MRIVIDIPQSKYTAIKEGWHGGVLDECIYDGIKKGKPIKTGHWIPDAKKSIFFEIYRCSECDNLVANNGMDYCPSCGSYNGGDAE